MDLYIYNKILHERSKILGNDKLSVKVVERQGLQLYFKGFISLRESLEKSTHNNQ